MSHTVILTPRALSDLRRNAEWMARHVSQRSADRWLSAAESAVLSLAQNPEHHPEANEALALGVSVRMLLHGRRRHMFRIYFSIDDLKVTVHRILHAAQDQLTQDDL